ncbi:dolichyl-phosphate-mannose--protein mannosyltransferase [Zarconia navalis]|uniref:dolichyl-phosphate-mannose--protein mannosyltransferase n=1 Tax=Zarconia navalis TaxID=2992134 RepID=UPI0021F860BC|nr:phospholipid carrier-dependent glycosyltransferase [Zarconia navalis]
MLSLTLRFWGLERFNTLVFDEVYYAKFAVNYLNGTEVFDAHPPLGKYIIAVGIWLSQLFAFQNTNDLTGQVLSPISYRWMNALVGSCIPIVVAGIAYQLSDRRSYAVLAGFFCAIDGFFLVESRYALINIYLVFFGLLGQWLFLISLRLKNDRKALISIGAGICFGASVSVKWNGLGFLLGIYLVYSIARLVKYLDLKENITIEANLKKSWFKNIANLKLIHLVLNLAFIPAIIYLLIWIPHLQLNPTETFWSVHQKILSYHQTGVGTGAQVHPYCSRWYTWPLMLRPMSYFYDRSTQNDIHSILPPLPTYFNEGIYDVHLMGNPILWWLSGGAISILILWGLTEVLPSVFSSRSQLSRANSFLIPLYLLTNYFANFLPWILVRRCTFIYLYMSAFIFSILAFSWLVDRWLNCDRLSHKIWAMSTILISVFAFIFWLPVYLGLPLSIEQFNLRMLLKSWI